MSRGSAPIYLELYPSRWLGGLLLVIHGGAILCALLIPVPWWARLSLAALFLTSLAYTFSRRVLSPVVTALLWDGDGVWRLWISGEEVVARLLPGSFVSPWCTVLNFALPGRRRARSIILFPDSAESSAFRRLRVRLRTDGLEESG